MGCLNPRAGCDKKRRFCRASLCISRVSIGYHGEYLSTSNACAVVFVVVEVPEM